MPPYNQSPYNEANPAGGPTNQNAVGSYQRTDGTWVAPQSGYALPPSWGGYDYSKETAQSRGMTDAQFSQWKDYFFGEGWKRPQNSQNTMGTPSVPNTISSSMLAPTTTFTPPAGSTGAYQNLGTTLNAYSPNPLPENQPLETTPLQTSNKTYLDSVRQKFADILGIQEQQPEITKKIYEEQGVAESKKALTEADAKLRSLDLNYIKDRENLIKGATDMASVQGQLNEYDRRYRMDRAVLAIEQQAASGRYSDAVSIAKNLVDAQFEPLNNQLQTLKAYIDFSQNDLSESEKLKLTAKLNADSAAATSLATMKKNAWESLIQNGGAGDAVARQALSVASTPSEIAAAISKYGVNPLDQQIKQGQLAKIYAEIGGGAQTGTQLGDSLYTQLKTRSVSFTELPADQKKLALKVFSDKGETIPRALTAKEKDAADQATSGLDAVTQLRELSKGGLPLTREFIFGQGTGVRGSVGRFLGTSNFINLANEATDIKTRIRTGAALNNQEIEFYKSQRPIYGDKPEDIQRKLSNLEGFYLGMSGLPVTITSADGSQVAQFDDLFNAKQRLGLRQAIAAGWTLSY